MNKALISADFYSITLNNNNAQTACLITETTTTTTSEEKKTVLKPFKNIFQPLPVEIQLTPNIISILKVKKTQLIGYSFKRGTYLANIIASSYNKCSNEIFNLLAGLVDRNTELDVLKSKYM